MSTPVKRAKEPHFNEGLRAALAVVQGSRKQRDPHSLSFAEQGIFRLIEERLLERIKQGERRA